MKPSIRDPLVRGCVPVGMAALLSMWLLYSTAETDAADNAALPAAGGSLAASSPPPNPLHAPRGHACYKAKDDTRGVHVRTGTLLADRPEVAIGNPGVTIGHPGVAIGQRWSEWEPDDPENARLTVQARRSVTF